MAEFFRSTIGRSLEFMVVKKIGKDFRNGVQCVQFPPQPSFGERCVTSQTTAAEEANAFSA